ncbi:MAG TPA: DUF427 domain-containing protein [Gammaproteobacteria bacterium]|nr:DUF427 domain-containing protein [Gammaproteobacteria bacterium]
MPGRKKSNLPPSSWGRNPGYEIDLEPLQARLRVELGGEVVAESENGVVMYELGHAPVYYFPRQDVRKERLAASVHHTHCPYKGDAGYFSVTAGGITAENAVWYYDNPYEEMAHLKGLLGFYFERFDAWYQDGRKMDAPVEIEDRINERNNFARKHPDLAADWHPEKNARIRPYEFSEHSDTMVWWKNVDKDEWRESIRSRVQRRRR